MEYKNICNLKEGALVELGTEKENENFWVRYHGQHVSVRGTSGQLRSQCFAIFLGQYGDEHNYFLCLIDGKKFAVNWHFFMGAA